MGLEDILTGNPIPEVTCPEGVSVSEGYKQKNGKNVSGKFFKKIMNGLIQVMTPLQVFFFQRR